MPTFIRRAACERQLPLNDVRTAEEEKVYRDQLARNAQILEENKQAAGQLDSMIGALEGKIAGMDKEKTFREEIAEKFRKGGKGGDKDWWALLALTEQDIIDIWGIPDSVSNQGTIRILHYTPESDTRRTVEIRDEKTGAVVGTQGEGERIACHVKFMLRIGGDKLDMRVVDYEVRGDGKNPRDGLGRSKEVLYSRIQK